MKRLNRLFAERLGDTAIVGVQDSVRRSDPSEPEPEVALLRPREDFYEARHPGPGDVLLLVEVSETFQAYDRDVKLPLYARSGVPEVWLVDLEGQRVDLCRPPSQDSYVEGARAGPGDALRPRDLPDVEVRVSEILS